MALFCENDPGVGGCLTKVKDNLIVVTWLTSVTSLMVLNPLSVRSHCSHCQIKEKPTILETSSSKGRKQVNKPVPVIMVTKFSTPLPWPNFLSARAAQFPSLSTHTGRWRALERGVRMSTELHSFISLVEWRTTPSCGFTRPPVLTPERNAKQMDSEWLSECVDR